MSIRKITQNVFISLAMVAAFIIIPGYALAAEAVTDDYILEETTVTATKTGETKLQETALAISVFDSDTMQNSNASIMSEISRYVPGFEVQGTGGSFTRHFIRGVGNKNYLGFSESSVGYYYNGVFLERGASGNNTAFDIERVEVMRGPQGTL